MPLSLSSLQTLSPFSNVLNLFEAIYVKACIFIEHNGQAETMLRCLQGDHLGCAKPPVDIDLKVAF